LSFALWTFSMTMFNSLKVAGLSSSLLYLQVLLPDSIQINLRVVHLLALIFLIAGLSTCIQIPQIATINSFFIFLICGFFIAGTRLQFFPQVLLACVFAFRNQQLQIRRPKTILGAGFAMAIGALFAVLLFSGGPDGNAHNELFFAASKWPFTMRQQVSVALTFILSLIVPFLIVAANLSRNHFRYFSLSIFIFVGSQFFFPHLFLRDIDFFVGHYFACAPIISFLIFQSVHAFLKRKKVLFIFAVLTVNGLLFRILFDAYHFGEHRGNLLFKAITWLSRREIYLSFSFAVVTFLLILFLSIFFDNFQIRRSPIALGYFAANLGVFVATSLNPFSDAIFNNESFSTRELNPVVERWESRALIDGLLLAKFSTSSDEIIATNFGVFEDKYGIDDFRFQILVDRQLYLTAKYSWLKMNFSAMFDASESEVSVGYRSELIRRFETSINFAVQPSEQYLTNMTSQGVSLYVVDLERTPLRSWEPWATTEFINDKVAVLRLAKSPTS